MGIIGSSIAVIAGVLAYLVPDARYLSFDIPFIFRPKADTSEVAIIYLDEDSHTKLKQPFGGVWSRALHVHLTDILRSQGAKVVVFDILWDKPWTEQPRSDIEQSYQQLLALAKEHPEFRLPAIAPNDVDLRLAEALKRHGKTLLAAKVSTAKDGQIEHTSPTFACDPLKDSGASGFTEVPMPFAIRRAVRWHLYSSDYPTMASVAAKLAGTSPAPPTQRRWFNYYGPPGTIESRSYYQVLQRDGVKSNFFAGKIVFVGMARVTTSQGISGDNFPTPYIFHDNMQGVEIQATACLNDLRGDWLTELSRRSHLLLFIAVGTLFGFLFSMVRPWVAVVFALLGFAGTSYAGIQTVWQTHTWFSWVVIACVQIPAALSWALLINTRRLYQDNVALEKELKKVTRHGTAVTPAEDPTVVAPAATLLVSSNVALPRGSQWQAQPGDVVADHELVRCVGRGAYGEVWLARTVIGTYAAMKIIYRSKFEDDAPFNREFEGLKRFMPVSRDHPGFVQILHGGKTGAFFYYVMQAGDDESTRQAINPETYAPRSLSGDLQKRVKLPLHECLKLALDLSSALDYLHRQNLIHRDIKPSNIIFVQDQPKIADIGLVTAMTTGANATYIGTPGYIAPEGPGTAAADIYSLGKVLYEAAMGRHVANCPALPTSLIERSDYKGLLELNEIITKAAADNINFRYQSAAALHADLLRLQTRFAKKV